MHSQLDILCAIILIVWMIMSSYEFYDDFKLKYGTTVDQSLATCDLMSQPCFGNSCELDCTRLMTE
jgi:hypothetical protein